jgi:hypothetical protein
LAATIALDEAEAAYELFMAGRRGRRSRTEAGGITPKQAKALQTAVASYMQEHTGAPLARWILELPEDPAKAVVRTVLSEVLLDDDFAGHDRLRVLISHWAAHELLLIAKP